MSDRICIKCNHLAVLCEACQGLRCACGCPTCTGVAQDARFDAARASNVTLMQVAAIAAEDGAILIALIEKKLRPAFETIANMSRDPASSALACAAVLHINTAMEGRGGARICGGCKHWADLDREIETGAEPEGLCRKLSWMCGAGWSCADWESGPTNSEED